MAEHTYIDNLELVCDLDCEELRRKDKSYGGSWKKRGGVGAFMMLARKWDRLEQMMQDPTKYAKWDIFDQVGDGSDGTPLAEIRDLRRYLLLVEAEILEQSHWHKMNVASRIAQPGTPEDGGHHECQDDPKERFTPQI